MSGEQDRRHTTRARGDLGTAILMRHRATTSFTVENISTTGVLLRGVVELSAGEIVRVLLHLAGEVSVGVAAEVTRVEEIADGGWRVALRFRDVELSIQARLDAIVRRAVDRHLASGPATVVVIDNDPVACTVAELDLQTLGFAMFRARTSLEVIRALADPSRRVRAVVVSTSLVAVHTSVMLRHLVDEHPGVRRILLHGPEANVSDFSTLQVEAFLRKPWDLGALAIALGVSVPSGG